MAETTKPQLKAQIDPNVQKLLDHIASLKEKAAESRKENDQVPWVRPPKDAGWDGDLTKEQGLIDLHKAFNTDKAEEQLIEAFTPGSPGVSADGIVLPLQIDYMQQAERAYRARVYQPFHRCLAHLVGREQGHGSDEGPLSGSVIEYFNTILKKGSGSS